jgi:hypothetical protein
LPAFFDRFETKTIGLEINKSSVSLKLPDSLEETERDKLIELLHENLDLFVTDDNPELGFTRVVEHKI